jgi:hypothetical protein
MRGAPFGLIVCAYGARGRRRLQIGRCGARPFGFDGPRFDMEPGTRRVDCRNKSGNDVNRVVLLDKTVIRGLVPRIHVHGPANGTVLNRTAPNYGIGLLDPIVGKARLGLENVL